MITITLPAWVAYMVGVAVLLLIVQEVLGTYLHWLKYKTWKLGGD